MDKRPYTEHSYQFFLSEQKLMGSRCESCKQLFLPPRPLCPACHGEQMTWEALSGEGTLAAFTTVLIGSTAMVEAGYDRNNPYVSGVVRLVEGPMISAQIVGIDAAHPAKISIGIPLNVAFIDRGEGEEKRTFLAFDAGAETS